MIVTDRKTTVANSDYCIEFPGRIFVWVKDSQVVDCNDELGMDEINQLLTYICKGLLNE